MMSNAPAVPRLWKLSTVEFPHYCRKSNIQRLLHVMRLVSWLYRCGS